MKLKHVTFTGVDERTDIKALQELQQRFYFAEFGVLTSLHYYENGNRYLTPSKFQNFHGKGLNLSLHLCGSIAREAANGRWAEVDRLTLDTLHLFKRVQLNIANRKDNPSFCWIPFVIWQELIVQQKDVDNMDVFTNTVERWQYHSDPISVLLDASGGRGVDTPIDILPNKWWKVGYAGGINPDNVEEKLTILMESPKVENFWIDMESGVRTDDWFDLNKVAKVLEICDNVIKKHDKV